MKRKIKKRRPPRMRRRNKKWRRMKGTIKHLFSIDPKQERKNEHFNPVYLAYNYSIEADLYNPFLKINFAVVDC